MSKLPNMFGKYCTSIKSHELYDSFEEKVERRKNLKLLELLETENGAELPFISPCSQSYADEIKAESIFFDKNQNLNQIPGPNKMSKCIDKSNLFIKETSIDTAIHGSAREKEAVIGTMKEYLGLAKYEVPETNEPVLSRNRFRTAIIDI